MNNNKAVLFGIDYSSSVCSLNEDKSYTHDIYAMKHFLENNFDFKNIEVFTNNNDKEVSGRYIIEKLSLIMSDSQIYKWDTLWIHFCGYACIDDEIDGGFLPKDYKTFGTISQDTFKIIFQKLYDDTKLICIFDCCQLKPFNEFKFQYAFEQDKMIIHKNYKFDSILSKKNIILITNYDDIENISWCSGVMTKYIIFIYNQNKHFSLMDVLLRLQRLLKMENYTCIPTLTSSMLITNTDRLLIKTR